MWFFSLFPLKLGLDSGALPVMPYIADVDTYGSWESWESSNLSKHLIHTMRSRISQLGTTWVLNSLALGAVQRNVI